MFSPHSLKLIQDKKLFLSPDTAGSPPPFEVDEDPPPLGTAECLVNADRVTVRHGLAFVDDKDSISEELAYEVSAKGFSLVVGFAAPGSIALRPGLGQVGLLRGSHIATSPGGMPHFAVTPVSAKHNIRSYMADKGLEARRAELCFKGDQGRGELNFNELNWTHTSANSIMLRDNVYYAYGRDVTVGNTITSYTDGVTNESVSFELVRSDFILKKGQRIGIAVFMQRRPTLKTAQHSDEHPLINTTVDDLRSVYGEPGRVNVYTGEIKLVGDVHIEHDINTFTSCSGSIVFLLDKNQPADSGVTEADYGKAIAVHAAAHPRIVLRNIAFTIGEELLSSQP